VELLFKLGYTLEKMLVKIPKLYPVDGPSRPTIVKYFPAIEKGTLMLVDEKPVGQKIKAEKVRAVAEAVDSNKYLSLREIASISKINKDTARRILHQELKLYKRNLRWVPHSLTIEQKKSRVELSKQLLKILRNEESSEFRHLLTGDESWLYYSYPHDSMWTRGRDVEERERRSIGTKKIILVVFWGFDETPVFQLLPDGESMNSDSFSSLVINPLKAYKAEALRESDELMIHMDNAPCHKSRKTRTDLKNAKLVLLPHPPYSPDLAPSDFFLFGFLKRRLKGVSCSTSEEILQKAREIMDHISRDTRLRVFHEWIWRLETIRDNGGEYF
jgi:histone-lysine N-methyltransferase SETMAR